MVLSPKLSFVNNNNLIGVGLALGSTIHFGSLEFITDLFGHLSMSPQERDSGAVFVGMVQSGSSSLRTVLGESSDEDGATSGTGGDWDPPASDGATW
jgi:hypothetical protein